MKKTKFKGMPVIIVALIACLVLFYNRTSDFYSIQYGQEDFRVVNLEDYSGESTRMLRYVEKTDSTITGLVKGAISLKSVGDGVTYNVELQYAATDDTTVFKIFAADYVSPDNSGGKIFVNEVIDPLKSEIKTSFVLDQSVDTLFVSIETQDENLKIGRLNIDSREYVFGDTYFLIFTTVVMAAVVLLLLNSRKELVKGAHINGHDIPADKLLAAILVVFAIAVFISSLPVLDTGIIIGHDTDFHMCRIQGIARAIESGQFPVRIHGGTLNDYGYPNGLFYPELLLYIPAVLTLFEVSVYTAFKVYVILVNAITLILAYIPFKKLTNSRSVGITLAIVYLITPYRILCGYWRSAMGEFTAMTFLPLVIYGLYAVIYGDKRDWKYLAVGATGVLQSHILTTEMTAVFAAVFVLIGIKELFTKEKRIVSLIVAAVTVVLLNLWFLGPMVLMMLQLELIVFNRPALTSRFASGDISNLFAINKIEFDGPYSIGILIVMALIIYLIYRAMAPENKVHKLKAMDNLMICTAVFMWTSTAWFPWIAIENVPLIGSVVTAIQFPTRFLTIVQLTGIVLMGLMLSKLLKNKERRNLVCAIVVLLAIYTNFAFIENTIIGDGFSIIESKSAYENNIDNLLSVGQAEYLVNGNNIDYMIGMPPVLESENETMTIENLTHWGTKMSFDYSMDLSEGNSDVIVLPVTYIPNYVIMVDGQRVYPFVTEGARVAFNVPSETGSVTVRYSEPRTFRACELVSLVSLMAFVFICTPKGKQLLSKIKKN